MKKYLIIFFLSFIGFTTYVFLGSSNNNEKYPSKITAEDLVSTPSLLITERDKKEAIIPKAMNNPFATNNELSLRDDDKKNIFKKTDYESKISNLGDSSIEIDLEENFSTDMNGNEIAMPFIPVSNGVENEYGEGVAKEFEPEVMAFNSKSTSELEENYISSSEGDIANSIMLEDSSNENEAASLMLGDNSIDNEYGEAVAREFQPAIMSLNTNFIPELEDNYISTNESNLTNPTLTEESNNGDDGSVLVFE
jgi:hypothetical protein